MGKGAVRGEEQGLTAVLDPRRPTSTPVRSCWSHSPGVRSRVSLSSRDAQARKDT
uniref:Uncharacterized protein n=1 Tax=Mandrillus leucophaeus TaxID=9568 RepID=A0A2K5ZKU4_MANLE